MVAERVTRKRRSCTVMKVAGGGIGKDVNWPAQVVVGSERRVCSLADQLDGEWVGMLAVVCGGEKDGAGAEEGGRDAREHICGRRG